jgi:hypothetical protein
LFTLTVSQDMQFRELLKQGKLEKHKFEDQWNPATGRRPKEPRGPAVLRLPKRTGINPFRLYGPHFAKHETQPKDLK